MTQTQKFPLQWSQAEELVSILKRWQGVNVDDDSDEELGAFLKRRRLNSPPAPAESSRLTQFDVGKFLKYKKFNTLNF